MRPQIILIATAISILFPGALPAEGPILAGVAWRDITPPLGTPSAGYGDRRGAGMTGVHDPLEAGTLVIKIGGETLVLTGVDNLGFGLDMVAEIKNRARQLPGLDRAHFLIGSSHTHAGGGAFFNNELWLYFSAHTTRIEKRSISKALWNQSALRRHPCNRHSWESDMQVPSLNRYRGDWPPNIKTNATLTVMKVTTEDGPLACLFDFPAHPTVLSGANMEFSADFVGYARNAAEKKIGRGVESVYFNGAQGDISPRPPSGEDGFEKAERMGEALGAAVAKLWDEIPVQTAMKLELARKAFTLTPQPNSVGMAIDLPAQELEFQAVVFDDAHAFVSIPGELSTVLDADIQRFAGWLGFERATILGLTNGAIGYMVTSESFRHCTYESTVSFGGPLFGSQVLETVYELMHEVEPEGAYYGQRPARATSAASKN